MAFTVLVGIEIVTVLGAEIVLGGERAPRVLELVKSLAALGLTTLVGAWIVTPRRDLLEDPSNLLRELDVMRILRRRCRERRRLLRGRRGRRGWRAGGSRCRDVRGAPGAANSPGATIGRATPTSRIQDEPLGV